MLQPVSPLPAWPPAWLTETAAETCNPTAPAVTRGPAAGWQRDDNEEIAAHPLPAMRFAGLVGNPHRGMALPAL